MTPRPAWIVPVLAVGTIALTISVVVALSDRPLSIPTAIAAVITALLLGMQIERRRGN